MSRLAFFSALLIGIIAAHAGEPHPSLPQPVIPDCLGVNIHFTDPKPGELEMIAAAGFKWVRMDFGWGGTERVKGEYDFSAYDRLAAALDKFKMRAVFILDYGNPLYANPGETQPFTARANTPEFREAFGKWAVAAVRHFKGRGYLWEMWNEPNGGFWKSADKTGDYIALAKATGGALQQAGLIGPKGEAFIGPATSTIDLPYLEACFKAGLLDYWDAVSVHPYRQNAPETVEEEYRHLRLLIRKYGPKGKVVPIISGEWGYSSAWGSLGKDEAARAEVQGKYLPREFLTNIANDVALSIWYDWHDDGTDPKEGEHRFGIVSNEYHASRDPVYDPKPAYLAMKTLTQQLRGFRFNKAFRYLPGDLASWLMTDAGDDYSRDKAWDCPCPPMQLWAKEKSYALVSWTAGPKPLTGEFPAVYSSGDAVDHLGKKVTAARNSESWKFKVDDSVEYRLFDESEMTPRLVAGWKRLPLEIVEAGPVDTKVPILFTNLFPHRLILPGWRESQSLFRNPPWNPGKREEVYSESTELLPAHQTASRDWDVFIGRIPPQFEEQIPLEVIYGVRPERLVFSQTLQCVADNPISVRFVGATGGALIPWEKSLPDEKARKAVMAAGARSFREPMKLFFEIAAGPEGLLPEKMSVDYFLTDFGLHLGEARIRFEGASRTALVSLDWNGSECTSISLETAAGKRLGSMEFKLADFQPLAWEVSKLRLTSDGDPKSHSEQSIETVVPPTGECPLKTPALRLQYQFAAGWRFLQLVPNDRTMAPAGEKTTKYEPKGFGIWVFGDGKGCQARLRFTDNTGQTFQSDGARIDWQGWRHVDFQLRPAGGKTLGHWGGANDGTIHYPIKWDAVFLLDNGSRQPLQGEIYLSAPTLIY